VTQITRRQCLNGKMEKLVQRFATLAFTDAACRRSSRGPWDGALGNPARWEMPSSTPSPNLSRYGTFCVQPRSATSRLTSPVNSTHKSAEILPVLLRAIFDGISGGCRPADVRFYPVSVQSGPARTHCVRLAPFDSSFQTGGWNHAQQTRRLWMDCHQSHAAEQAAWRSSG
jgi:hypothetical protein